MLTSTPSATTQVGQAYLQTNVVQNGVPGYTYLLSGGTLPAGTLLDPGTGTVAGTPTTAGAFSYTIQVVDGGGDTAMQTVSGAIAQATSGTSLQPNPGTSTVGQQVTFTATVAGSSPTGTVTFNFGDGTSVTSNLASGQAQATHTYAVVGDYTVTASYNGDGNNASSIGTAGQRVNQAATSTALVSSKNPSEVGQAVTFTATVTSSGGTPSGTVNFFDGGAMIGSAALSGGVASFTTSALTKGSHSITAVYAGNAAFATSPSPVLVQAVNTPADSLKLRAMQALAAPTVAQVSGQAISGAVDSAIAEGFADGGPLVAPSASGVRFNFAGDPDAKPVNSTTRSTDPFSSANGSFASSGHGFGALAYAGPTKAPPPPPRIVEPREWLGWAEVRGATLDHWNASGIAGATPGAAELYGSQVNVLAGITRKFAANFLVGVLGGYETFDYRSDDLQGRLKGDGWTVGAYLGWLLTRNIRYDAAVAYSGIGYDGTAGTATGSFGGHRWLLSTGLTGSYQSYGIQIEPSARVYALWENEDAYTDTLGTLQTARDFSTGRASGGVKLSYPIASSPTAMWAPYVGLYGDYYFNTDSAGAAALTVAALPSAIMLDGWSARAVGGNAAKFNNGAQVALGAERAGIGGSFGFWTYRARASVPFVAQ